jgi:hypothetical protein
MNGLVAIDAKRGGYAEKICSDGSSVFPRGREAAASKARVAALAEVTLYR